VAHHLRMPITKRADGFIQVLFIQMLIPLAHQWKIFVDQIA